MSEYQASPRRLTLRYFSIAIASSAAVVLSIAASKTGAGQQPAQPYPARTGAPLADISKGP